MNEEVPGINRVVIEIIGVFWTSADNSKGGDSFSKWDDFVGERGQ